MMVTSTDNAEHYIWGAACDGWHLLKSDRLSVIHECMPPGTSELLHYHNQSQQLFYVLSGTATFLANGETIDVLPNQSLHIPNATQHLIQNIGHTELHFLVISQPKINGDRINL